jgi:DNA-binding NarL/FixJ family response regulator
MSDRPLKLLLIDQDPIFRLGLQVALDAIPNLEVIAAVESDTAALQTLAEIAQQDPNQVNLVVLELGNVRSIASQQLGLQFCRQIRTLYPNLPIMLLSSVQNQELLMVARDIGVNGYYPKGTPVLELAATMREVAEGGFYWFDERTRLEEGEIGRGGEFLQIRTQNSPLPLAKLRNNLRLSGLDYIEATLATVTRQLQIPGLPLLDRAILAGQRRELLAARWLLNGLLILPQERQQEQQKRITSPREQPPPIPSLSTAVTRSDSQQSQTLPSSLNSRALQSALFASCVNKLQFPLHNVTDEPLEIDIFREDKRRELLYLILQKFADQLEEMRASQVDIIQLYEIKNTLLRDLWQRATTDFFGKFSRIKVSNQNIEIVDLLLQNTRIVQKEILNQIPLVTELFSYLLFKTDLQIDNTSYPAVSVEAKSQALMILENLLIKIANGVVQPLLNYLADVEIIKQNFYTRQLISTREIERFRNNLSWKYTLNNLIKEPKAIFESRYELFVIAPRGIAKTSVYASRSQELVRLSNIPLFITLLLEFRDAIAPRLQSLLAFLGSGIVFVLTQVIGRGLGLIGRGILQGIGSVSLTEKNLRKNSDRPK